MRRSAVVEWERWGGTMIDKKTCCPQWPVMADREAGARKTWTKFHARLSYRDNYLMWNNNSTNRSNSCAQLCLTLCVCTDCSPPGSSAHGIVWARILEWVAIPPPRDLPDPGIEPKSWHLLHCQADSWPLAPPGKPCWLRGKEPTCKVRDVAQESRVQFLS